MDQKLSSTRLEIVMFFPRNVLIYYLQLTGSFTSKYSKVYFQILRFGFKIGFLSCVSLFWSPHSNVNQHDALTEAVVQRCSVKKMFSEFRKIEWKTTVPETLLQKSFWHRCFPVSFAKFLRTPFFTEHLRRLFLQLVWKVTSPLWQKMCLSQF